MSAFSKITESYELLSTQNLIYMLWCGGGWTGQSWILLALLAVGIMVTKTVAASMTGLSMIHTARGSPFMTFDNWLCPWILKRLLRWALDLQKRSPISHVPNKISALSWQFRKNNILWIKKEVHYFPEVDLKTGLSTQKCIIFNLSLI